ncbi:MAG: hypothetical protein KatS3mg007_1917 [Thermoanaerobaculum sp.]|jgi:hypothetical protein|nr:MAG: hypothetical protein KatS3mg007_1917 [Thermoanaerobaculum sp.]
MKGVIQGLIAKCRVAAKQPGAYGFLPDIIGELEDIKSELEKGQPTLSAYWYGPGVWVGW